MPIPDYQEVMLPLLKRLGETDLISIREITKTLSSDFLLTEEERSETLKDGRTRKIESKVGWACTYLAQAGLIYRPKRGFVAISDLGKNVLNEKLNRIDNKYLMKYESFRSFINRVRTPQERNENALDSTLENFTSQTPEDIIYDSFDKIQTATRNELLESIIKSTPVFFERLILDLFQAMGYGVNGKIIHSGKTGDGGIDGIIDEDPLGLDKIYLQAKRYSPDNKIGIEQIRSFAGSLDERGAHKGIFVTTSAFVQNAYDYADRSPKSLVLIDGELLTNLMYKYGIGLRVVDTLHLKKIDSDYFEELA